MKIRESSTFHGCVKSLLDSLDVSRNVEPENFNNEYQKERFLRLLIYLTAFNLGAKDWLSDTKIGYDKLPGFKPHWHHFFPKGKRVLKGTGFKEEANALANITVLNEKTNRIISSNPPVKYIDRLEIPLERLKEQFIPLDQELWKVENYKRFLEERAKLLSDGCNSFLDSLRTGLE